MRAYLLGLAACSATASPQAAPANPAAWDVPAGWRSEVIAFPLDFAPAIAHAGTEELRFPPGFFTATSPEYWAYTFVWRTTDPAELDAGALAGELTAYFRGLVTAVDATKHQVTDLGAITVTATRQGGRFALAAHVFDAFGAANAVELDGWAERRACAGGALWVFVLAPAHADPAVRARLDTLAAKASCH